LTENPFPSQAILNKDSTEKKNNGTIYEPEIRTMEYQKLLNNFLKVPQSNLDHLRLGFLLDSSYIGRGNGKSAFLLNVHREINSNFGLNLSDGVNKCFSVYFQPEAGGKTKTFDSFVDLFFQSILDTNIIQYSLAILRLESILKLKGNDDFLEGLGDEENIVNKLNDEDWYNEKLKELELTRQDIALDFSQNSFLQTLPAQFPLLNEKRFLTPLTNQKHFTSYYSDLKKGKEKFDFVFSYLVSFFLAAGFNGAYVFVDDFERIPDHLSAIQKKDFVTQLRTVTYDGLYLNSKIGFFNFLFALHAGVPRMLQEAWGLSGLEQRISLNPSFDNPRHMIMFSRITVKHAALLIHKYLSEFRIKPIEEENIYYPFTEDAIEEIGIKAELNAAKILQMAYNIIENAADEKVPEINKLYVQQLMKQSSSLVENQINDDSISKTETIDLINKASQ
jgi:hypothetical protein